MAKLNFRSLLLIIVAFLTLQMNAQKEGKEIKLKTIKYEMVVNVTTQKAWDVLNSYGDIGSFHAGLESSSAINGSPNIAQMDCERICYIPRTKNKKIMVKEKIIDYSEGNYYTYDVYEWENFPLKKMNNTFGVKTNAQGETVIYQVTNFRLKPGFLTGMMKGKLRRGARTTLMGYKRYMETGDKRIDIKELKKQYKSF